MLSEHQALYMLQMQCGGVSLLSPGSVSTDVDEAMRPGGFSDFSRSSAGDAVPSGDNSALQVFVASVAVIMAFHTSAPSSTSMRNNPLCAQVTPLRHTNK
jgi:hypothetical protein